MELDNQELGKMHRQLEGRKAEIEQCIDAITNLKQIKSEIKENDLPPEEIEFLEEEEDELEKEVQELFEQF